MMQNLFRVALRLSSSRAAKVFLLSFLCIHLSFLPESVILPQCQAALDNLSQLIRSQSCFHKPVSFNPHAVDYLLNDII